MTVALLLMKINTLVHLQVQLHVSGITDLFLCVFVCVLCVSVPVLLVMFGDLFVEVLWGVGDEAVFGQIARTMLRFTVVSYLSCRVRERKREGIYPINESTFCQINKPRRGKTDETWGRQRGLNSVNTDMLHNYPYWNVVWHRNALMFCMMHSIMELIYLVVCNWEKIKHIYF